VLTGIHFLLTYKCIYECDHCFLHCGPDSCGTFTLAQLRSVFAEIDRIGTIDTVYFEGGEPFLYYPLMIEGLRLARTRGLKAGVVTNGYWATSKDDARIWLEPLLELGVVDLSISDDAFHESTEPHSPPKLAYAAAKTMGIPCDTICIEAPAVLAETDPARRKGEPVIGGAVRFRGRAAEKLTSDLPRRPARSLVTCPDEDLKNPERVHVDGYGNVHLCQGLLMGNLWDVPLSTLVKEYDARRHPICGPLVAGGPAQLAAEYGLEADGEFVDECHYCYSLRRALLDRFPAYLGPRQVYGLA